MARKKNAIRKNVLREVLRTKSRFFAIFAIIGISVGFFSGLKSASPSMLKTSLTYLEDHALMDIRLVSTVGFDDEDIRDLSGLDYVDSVMPGYTSDLIVTQNDIDSVVRVFSVPQQTETNSKPINEVILREGRLPENEGECAIENYYLEMSGYHLGDTITFNPKVEGKPATDYVKHTEYKIVGLVDSPLFLTYLRGNSLIGDGNVAFYMIIPPEEFSSEKYTVAYLRTKASAEYDFPFGDGYKNEIRDEKEKLEEFSHHSIERFNSTTLADAKKQLELGKSLFLQKKDEALKKIAEAEQELQNSEKQFNSMIAEEKKKPGYDKAKLEEMIKSGSEKFRESREKLDTEKKAVQLQISEAEEKLNEAEQKISKLENGKWYVYDRDDNPGYSGLYEDSTRVDEISKVFPVFFLLIAGLVCFTTMTRMVEERRTETGTLKALGYSNISIAMKYVIYSGTAALFGSIAGAALGVLTLPGIIVDTYRIMYTFPPTIIEVEWKSLIISSLVGVVCIMLVSFAACFKDLRLAPASLMRPKAPKPGKRILLEHIKPLWNHMGFTSKVTARNLFRYKARFFMTVIGVAGCTALMVAGFGLKDSVAGIADIQFDELTIYDQVYSLSESGTADSKSQIMSKFRNDERFEHSLLAYLGWGYIQNGDSGKKPQIRIMIGDDQEEFKNVFVLRDRKTHDEVSLTDDGIILVERLADVLKVGTGDDVVLTLDGEKYTCKVAGFTENYAGSLGYMTPAYYKKLTGSDVKYSVVLTRIADNYRSSEKNLANEYMKDDDIITVTSITEQISTMKTMIQSLDLIILVLIVCAGLLAVVVLYNLTNINIAERVREIATIKVLGFYSLETANYIYREITALTVIGAAAGLALGNVFATFVVESIQMDNVMFPKYVSFWSYMFSFALTIVFSLAVNFIMYFKMKKINMVESLKSIE